MHSSGSTSETGQIECRNLPYKRNLCRLAPCYMYFFFKAVKSYFFVMVMDNNCRKSFTTSEAWQRRLDHKKQNDLYGTYTSLTRHGLNICISL